MQPYKRFENLEQIMENVMRQLKGFSKKSVPGAFGQSYSVEKRVLIIKRLL